MILPPGHCSKASMIVDAADVPLARALCDIEYGDVFDSFTVRLVDCYGFMVSASTHSGCVVDQHPPRIGIA